MAASPTQRSMEFLRSQGFLVAVVEKYNHHAKVTQDLFGVIDILDIRKNETIAVQTTSGSNLASRRKKMLSHENLSRIQAAGWQVKLHGWRKNAKAKWVLREESLIPNSAVQLVSKLE